MKLLNRLTIKSLRLNKKRTIVTIVGIILATALLTAVSTMAVSFRQGLVEREKSVSGDFDFSFEGVPTDELKYIEQNKNVAKYYKTAEVGYAQLRGSRNPDKPYLYIEAMDEGAFAQAGVHLTEGRLPKNDSEIVISDHIDTNGGVTYAIGDYLTLEVGERNMQGISLKQFDSYTYDEETLETTETKTYQIVGICERLSYKIEPRMAPGYTVITYLSDAVTAATNDIYVTYTKSALKNRYQVTADILGIDESLCRKYFEGHEVLSESELTTISNMKYDCTGNIYLIRYKTLDFKETSLSMMYGVVAIVLLIIVFTSVFCIRNSFAISITEKKRQYGMLASVGATSRQIKRNVYYEAMILALIAIPLGVLSGIAASAIVVQVVSGLLENALVSNFVLKLSVSPMAIILSILLAIVMIFLSARKPAKEAAKVSPIEAISGVSEVNIKAREVKTPKLIKRIFGIGGALAYKNMRRNRKKYRVSVISIAVSVIVFIPLYYFIHLAFSASGYFIGSQSYNLSIGSYNASEDYEKMVAISQLDGVKESTIMRFASMQLAVEDAAFTTDYRKLDEMDMTTVDAISLELVSLGAAQYEQYTKQLGLENSGSTTEDGILLNDYMSYNPEKGRTEVIDIYDYRKGDTINGKLEGDTGAETETSFNIAAVTNVRPMGLEDSYNSTGYLIVTDAWMDAHADVVWSYANMYMDCEDPDSVQSQMETDYSIVEGYVNNEKQNYNQMKALYTVIAIFLYGFIIVIALIGITNIFNTITTAMDLRSKEFAMLKSMGMTHREFNRMVGMESVFYGTKALLFGIPIGVALSYLIYYQMAKGMEVGFQFPIEAIVIAAVVVFLLLFAIMRYSVKRISRQNIIETIRQDNI